MFSTSGHRPSETRAPRAYRPGGREPVVQRLGHPPSLGCPHRLLHNEEGNLMAESITAIDILMEPDATMVQHAEAVNARLRGVFPKGYSLDETHRPHLTTLQRFVRTVNLDRLCEAAGKIITSAHPETWMLTAFKYYYVPSTEIGVAGIVVRPTDAWLEMQHKLIDVVAPFTVKTATNDAFYELAEPNLGQQLIDYVATFIPQHVGNNFSPHVSVGVATRDYLDKMLTEPFEEFTFSLAGASVYQLGDYGTARKVLKSWPFSASA